VLCVLWFEPADDALFIGEAAIERWQLRVRSLQCLMLHHDGAVMLIAPCIIHCSDCLLHPQEFCQTGCWLGLAQLQRTLLERWSASL